MTIDTDGMLWIACFFGGRVMRMDPETGLIFLMTCFKIEMIFSAHRLTPFNIKRENPRSEMTNYTRN